MVRPKWPKPLVKLVFDKDAGKCHHCGVKLRFREPSGPRMWEIDHFPVVYRDIEDQCCIGVTDPLEPTNLVASCRTCNRSHAHEVSRWCGHSQPRCRKRWGYMALYVLGVLTSGVVGVGVGRQLMPACG